MFASHGVHWSVICYIFHTLEWKDALAKAKSTSFTSEFAAQVIPLHLKLPLKVLILIYEVIINTYMDAEDFFMTINIIIKIPTGMNVFG